MSESIYISLFRLSIPLGKHETSQHLLVHIHAGSDLAGHLGLLKIRFGIASTTSSRDKARKAPVQERPALYGGYASRSSSIPLEEYTLFPAFLLALKGGSNSSE